MLRVLYARFFIMYQCLLKDLCPIHSHKKSTKIKKSFRFHIQKTGIIKGKTLKNTKILVVLLNSNEGCHGFRR